MPLCRILIIKHLRTAHCRVLIAVLVDAHGDQRSFFCDDCNAPLHILCFFMRGIRIVQSFLRLTRQHDAVALRFQKCLQFFCVDEIQFFFVDSARPNHARIVPAMAGIQDDCALCCLRVPAALLTVF